MKMKYKKPEIKVLNMETLTMCFDSTDRHHHHHHHHATEYEVDDTDNNEEDTDDNVWSVI
jgi:hypothetical protein